MHEIICTQCILLFHGIYCARGTGILSSFFVLISTFLVKMIRTPRDSSSNHRRLVCSEGLYRLSILIANALLNGVPPSASALLPVIDLIRNILPQTIKVFGHIIFYRIALFLSPHISVQWNQINLMSMNIWRRLAGHMCLVIVHVRTVPQTSFGRLLPRSGAPVRVFE